MQWLYWSLGAVLLLLAGLIAWMFMDHPDLSEYESLLEPRIRFLADQQMLEIEIAGDPSEAGGEAMGRLFNTYYTLKDVPKGPTQPAPRGRWPIAFDAPKTEWVGRFALPIPDTVVALPEQSDDSTRQVRISIWEYGDVAEILHIGPYTTETETIERLMTYINDSGYEVVGDHEEEYLRGPGMFPPVPPASYYTIIRYRVREI